MVIKSQTSTMDLEMEMEMEMDLEWSGVMFHWDNEHRKEMEWVVGIYH
jgi:hypothetical protein